MARRLTKDITRETLSVTDMKNNRVIVTLKAGDMFEFRSKGKRFRMDVPIANCYYMAMVYTAAQRYKERMARYLAGRKEGRRMRKPQRLPRIFHPSVYQALLMQ